MKIDIIAYTDEQFALLTEEQLLEVKTAQLKKNELDAALAEELENEKQRLVERGIFLSGIWDLYCAKRTAERDAEVENLRDSLLFYLRFSVRAADEAPYTVDYALTLEERLAIVRAYYDGAYTDAVKRYEAFKTDKVAAQYLGELYAPLDDYYYTLAYTV